jgi:hypothetical protein
MKGKMTYGRIVIVLFLIVFCNCYLQAQQNNTLFFMHSLPEANFLNPAVQARCPVFIGLPLVSSLHLNAASSGFTGSQFTNVEGGEFVRDRSFDPTTINRKNFLLWEVHAVILALGIRRNEYYYTFTVMEKDNAALLYTRDLAVFSIDGSGPFTGRLVNLKGTGGVFNHYREYALGISRVMSRSLTLGIKAKLLFGKFNLETTGNHFDMNIDMGTRDILFNVDAGYNSSLPVSLQMESDGNYRFYQRYDASVPGYLMNNGNPGLAVDAGFIYNYSDRLVFSGSLLDLGFIAYRSNLTNFSLTGEYLYSGPFGDGTGDDRYLWDVFDELNDNMTEELTYDSYTYFLDPKLYLGASYRYNDRYDINLLWYNRLLPGKLQTGVTVSVLAHPRPSLETSISWSYMNHSFLNLGMGLGYVKGPWQIYLVSDNIPGLVLPMRTKNVNLRLGINLNLGCRKMFDINQCGCSWLRDAEKKSARKEEFKRGNKR